LQAFPNRLRFACEKKRFFALVVDDNGVIAVVAKN